MRAISLLALGYLVLPSLNKVIIIIIIITCIVFWLIRATDLFWLFSLPSPLGITRVYILYFVCVNYIYINESFAFSPGQIYTLVKNRKPQIRAMMSLNSRDDNKCCLHLSLVSLRSALTNASTGPMRPKSASNTPKRGEAIYIVY